MPYKEVSNKEEHIQQSCRCLFKPFVEQTNKDRERVDELLERAAETFTIIEMEIFTLRFIEQKSYREIGKQLGYKTHCPAQYHVRSIIRKLKPSKEN